MSKEIQKVEKSTDVIEPKDLTLKDVKQYVCAEATEKEVFLFLQIAKSCNLNPFLKEIYLVKYGTQPAQILTSYNVYLQRAERSGKYAGLETSTIGSVGTKDLRGIVKVFRKDWEKPLVHEVYYDEYVQRKKDGAINKFWRTKPRTMIVKVAISQAFRLAFPLDFEGMPYTQDEMNNIEMPTMIEEKTVQEKPQKFAPPPKEPEAVDAEFVEEEKSEFISQEELTALIMVAISSKWKPTAIENQLSQLGYRLSGNVKKSLKLNEFIDPMSRHDYETLLETVSKPEVENETKE